MPPGRFRRLVISFEYLPTRMASWFCTLAIGVDSRLPPTAARLVRKLVLAVGFFLPIGMWRYFPRAYFPTGFPPRYPKPRRTEEAIPIYRALWSFLATIWVYLPPVSFVKSHLVTGATWTGAVGEKITPPSVHGRDFDATVRRGARKFWWYINFERLLFLLWCASLCLWAGQAFGWKHFQWVQDGSWIKLTLSAVAAAYVAGILAGKIWLSLPLGFRSFLKGVVGVVFGVVFFVPLKMWDALPPVCLIRSRYVVSLVNKSMRRPNARSHYVALWRLLLCERVLFLVWGAALALWLGQAFEVGWTHFQWVDSFWIKGALCVYAIFYCLVWKDNQRPYIPPPLDMREIEAAAIRAANGELAAFKTEKGVYIGCALEAEYFDYFPKQEGPEDFRVVGRPVPLRFGGDGHLLTVGKMGSGKGTTAIIPALMDYKGSALVIDPKGQLAAVTTPQRQSLGQKTYYINPFDLFGIPSASHNPLDYLDPAALDFETQCRGIAEGLIDIKKGEHWEVSALDVVALLIQWVVVNDGADGYKKDLVQVRELLALSDVHTKDHPSERCEFFEMLQNHPNDHIGQAANRYASDSKEVGDCIQTAVVQMAFLRDRGIERILRGGKGLPPLSFATLKREPSTIYLMIPADRLRTHGKFLRLLVMSAYHELMNERRRQEEDVLFLLDEFLQLGHMAAIGEMSRVCRDFQLRLWLIVQDLPGLKDVYKEGWESLLGNSGIMQFFGANDGTTMEYVEKLSETKIEIAKSVAVNDSSTLATTWGISSGASSGEHNSSTSAGQQSGGSHSSTRSRTETTSERVVPAWKRHQVRGISNTRQLAFMPSNENALHLWRLPYWQMFPPEIKTLDPYHKGDEDLEKWLEWIASGESFFSKPGENSLCKIGANRPIYLPDEVEKKVKAHFTAAKRKAVYERQGQG